MALDVITWMWGTKYGTEDVSRLARCVRRNLSIDHRFHLFSDVQLDSSFGIVLHSIPDKNLMDRSCFCRLRMFDPAWQKENGLDGKIISLDLDLVIVGKLDPIFEGESTFKILQGVNEVNPNPFNASVMMLQAGCHSEVWTDFSLEKAKEVPFHEFPDDQGWIHYKLPEADGWRPGPDGIYGFQKPGWPKNGWRYPGDARIVSFIGKRKPKMYSHLWWVKKYWIEA